MATELTVDETTLDVTVTVSNERGPAGPAGVVEAVEVGDITPVSSGKLIGRHGGGSGAAQEVGLDGGLEFQGANIRREALTGDVTASAGSNATTIADDAVTNTKLANMAEGTIKGRASGAGTGDPQDLTAEQVQAIATTAASIDTALSTASDAQERSIRASLRTTSDTFDEHDVINNQFNSAHKWANWTGGVGGTSQPLRWMAIGDSYSIGLGMGPKMGVNGIIGLKPVNTTGTVTSHSIANGNARHDLWIDGTVTQLAVGATSQFTAGGLATGDVRGTRIGLSFIKYSGGGSFVIQSAPNGTGSNTASDDTGWTTHATIDTNNATTIGDYVEYTVSGSNYPSYRIRIKSVTTAPVFIVHPGVYANRGGGVIRIDAGSVGGWDLTNLQSTITAAVFDPLWRFLSPDLVTVCFADAAAEWESGGNFRWLYDRMIAANTFSLTNAATTAGSASITHDANTLLRQGFRVTGGTLNVGSAVASMTSSTATVLSGPAVSTQSGLTLTASKTPDVIIVGGNPPSSGNAADRIAADEAQREWALETGNTFIAGRHIFRSYDHAQTAGMMSDTTHLSAAAARYRNVHLWSRVPIGWLDLGGNCEAFPGAGVGGQFFNFYPVDDGTDRGPAVIEKPLMSYGSLAEIVASDQTTPMNFGNRVGFRGRGGELFAFNQVGEFAIGGVSSLRGWHPVANGDLLGGRGAFFWSLNGAGARWEYLERTADYTLTRADHTVNVPANSVNITLPTPVATNSSTAASHNVGAGLRGKVFCICNNGAGTVTLIGTVNGVTNPTIAAGNRMTVQSTGTAWIQIY